jgi:hypothetical protein
VLHLLWGGAVQRQMNQDTVTPILSMKLTELLFKPSALPKSIGRKATTDMRQEERKEQPKLREAHKGYKGVHKPHEETINSASTDFVFFPAFRKTAVFINGTRGKNPGHGGGRRGRKGARLGKAGGGRRDEERRGQRPPGVGCNNPVAASLEFF